MKESESIRRKCKYFLLRYAPDGVKEEFVNVGVVLYAEASEGERGFADIRFTREWRRVRCIDPEADVEVLEGMEREIKDRMVEGGEAERWLLDRMRETFSNALQVSETKALLAVSPEAELGRLAEMYLEGRRRPGRVSGRQAVYAAMRGEFERQGVWALMRHNIAASEYTHKGDPLKIDCGYRPNGVVHMYHALSLESEATAAKALAFTFPRLREGIERLEKAGLTLTAVVENGLNRDEESVAFAVETLETSGIMVVEQSEMERLASEVRRQMGHPGS